MIPQAFRQRCICPTPSGLRTEILIADLNQLRDSEARIASTKNRAGGGRVRDGNQCQHRRAPMLSWLLRLTLFLCTLGFLRCVSGQSEGRRSGPTTHSKNNSASFAVLEIPPWHLLPCPFFQVASHLENQDRSVFLRDLRKLAQVLLNIESWKWWPLSSAAIIIPL